MLFLRLPSAFLPAEDQGTLIAQVMTPVGATQQRTLQSIEKVEQHFLETEKEVVKSVFAVQGFSFGGGGQNAGMIWVNLKPWDERKSADLHVDAVGRRAMGALMQIKDAMAFAFAPPPIPELGSATGFDFFLKDNAGLGHDALVAARNQFLGLAAQSKLLANVRPNGQDDTPQFHIDVDRERASSLGLSLDRRQLDAVHGLGRPVHRRLHRPRSRQARLHAGRRAVPHVARGPPALVGAQQAGRDGALLRVRGLALGVRLAASRALQRRLRNGDPGPGRARSQHG